MSHVVSSMRMGQFKDLVTSSGEMADCSLTITPPLSPHFPKHVGEAVRFDELLLSVNTGHDM